MDQSTRARALEPLAVPLAAALGARLLSEDDPATGGRFKVGPLASNGAGGLHAAALGAIIELAGFLAVLPTLDAAEHAVTHAISTQLMSAARDGDTETVRGRLDRRTRRLAFVSVEAGVEDAMIARAQLTKSIVAC